MDPPAAYPAPQRPLRWGILSTARIVRRNWPAMLASGAAELAGLASRDPASAAAFIGEMQALHPWPEPPAVFGTYQALLDSPAIEAVYIPLPTALRKEWVLRAAAAGKHVLCEKPCAIHAADLEEMIACCRANGVLFMDGVMFMHDPRYPLLRRILDDGTSVGPLRRITSAFSFRGSAEFLAGDIRLTGGLEPTGCLGDLGWYCLRASLWAMHWQLPQRVSGRILSSVPAADGSSGVTAFAGELDFAAGVHASFDCSFLIPGRRWLELAGTEGTLRIPDFVVPVPENDVDWELGYDRVPRAGFPGAVGAEGLFRTFAREVAAGGFSPHWAMIALKTQQLLDACWESARLGRPLFLDDGAYTDAGA